MLSVYFQALRPWQWMKNVLIFVPYFLTLGLKTIPLNMLIITFILFSFFVSGTYILNDIRDIENDKYHPQKKLRPIASGLISIKNARVYAFVLLILSTFIQSIINLNSALFFLIYFLITSIYSIQLKYVNFFDSLSISILFCLRLVLGSVVSDIQATTELIVYVFFTSFFISILKKNSIINSNITSKNKFYLLLKKQNSKSKFQYTLFISGLFSNLSLNVWGLQFYSANNINKNIAISLFMFFYLIFTINLVSNSKKGTLEDLVLGIVKNKFLNFLIFIQFILFLYFYF
tara:strand:+ start:620 stop:1486 length:867 start_codon:yes stop_codon:yes gene_type:complete